MLRSLKELENYAVSATDGDVGRVVNFLFDDEHWAVRHLVVETGSFFDERQVLVSPVSFRNADWSSKRFHLELTMDKIKRCPSVDADRPVSRQHEADYHDYYAYPYYWGYARAWGVGVSPALLLEGMRSSSTAEKSHHPGDVHLRSARDVRGYHVQGRDLAIGHIDDFIVDDETWEVRYLVVDTTNWWFGKKLLVSPHWANEVSWLERTVYMNLSRQALKDSPEWNPDAAGNRELEVRLYDYYGRPAYWDSPRHGSTTPDRPEA